MKAASHVPKVYLVKVAGKPDLEGLEKLRRGISISETRFVTRKGIRDGSAGEDARASDNKTSRHAAKNSFLDSPAQSADRLNTARNDRVRTNDGKRIKTAPAKIRMVREADNPWYEVTLTEGKNRQIRRMFEEIGHHVEKIKRVRYGPLNLDVPPGEFRKLDSEEVERLKATAELAKQNAKRRAG
jgi:23S rRNA pseudouridine2605 synthase